MPVPRGLRGRHQSDRAQPGSEQTQQGLDGILGHRTGTGEAPRGRLDAAVAKYESAGGGRRHQDDARPCHHQQPGPPADPDQESRHVVIGPRLEDRERQHHQHAREDQVDHPCREAGRQTGGATTVQGVAGRLVVRGGRRESRHTSTHSPRRAPRRRAISHAPDGCSTDIGCPDLRCTDISGPGRLAAVRLASQGIGAGLLVEHGQVGLLFHRLTSHSYPHRPLPAPDAGLHLADIDAALEDMHEIFDISREDLDALLSRAEMHAAKRKAT